jgi:hypothetical protein
VDEQRFDTWTRTLARPGSRRRLVRALVGGGALLAAARHGLSDVAAHHGKAGPGDPCRTADQCIEADGPMDCAWNGYGSAGQYCCTWEGSTCLDDRGCCGENLCIRGICTSQTSTCTYEGYGCASSGECCGAAVCLKGICTRTTGSCTGYNCECYQDPFNDPADPCDPGLICCHESGNWGRCLPQDTCYPGGVPGELCPRFCLPGPTQCPGCISGYCTPSGVCG